MRLSAYDYEWLLAMVEARVKEEAEAANQATSEQQRTLARMDELRARDIAQRLRDHLGTF